jgi:hypothetical protein
VWAVAACTPMECWMRATSGEWGVGVGVSGKGQLGCRSGLQCGQRQPVCLWSAGRRIQMVSGVGESREHVILG